MRNSILLRLTSGSLWVSSGRVASQALGEAQQSRLEFAAKNRSNAELSQEHFVHRRIQPVNAQVGPGGERLDARNRFDRDARSGVHADVERHEAGAGQAAGLELLQRKVDARHLETRPFQPCGGLGEREGLTPQFVRIDQHRLELHVGFHAPMASRACRRARREMFAGPAGRFSRANAILRLWPLFECATRRAHGSPGFLHALEVVPPHFFLVEAVVIEKVPRIDAGIVAIGEGGLYRVGADRLDMLDLDILLADLQDLLARPMAAHFRGRRVDPQKLAGERKRLAVGKRDFQHAGLLVQLDFRRAGGVPVRTLPWQGSFIALSRRSKKAGPPRSESQNHNPHQCGAHHTAPTRALAPRETPFYRGHHPDMTGGFPAVSPRAPLLKREARVANLHFSRPRFQPLVDACGDGMRVNGSWVKVCDPRSSAA